MHTLPETGYLRLHQIVGDPKAEPGNAGVMSGPRLAEVVVPCTFGVVLVLATAPVEIGLDIPFVKLVMQSISWPEARQQTNRNAHQADH